MSTPRHAPTPATWSALARTCFAFHDIALDELWRHQETIVNLIRCMPADLWELVDGTTTRRTALRPTREIVSCDWRRFDYYARRVKSLRCHDDCGPDLSAVFTTLLGTISDRSLLPRLESFACSHQDTYDPAHIKLLRSPRLTSICFDAFDYHAQQVLIPIVALNFPALSVISLHVYHPYALERHPRVSTFIRSLPSVRVFQLFNCIADAPALMHLGRLPTLATLDVCLPESLYFPNSSDRSMFSNLRAVDLTVYDTDILPLSAFLRTWNQPQLVSLEITFDGIRFPPPGHHPRDISLELIANPTDFLRQLFCFTNLESLMTLAPAQLLFDDDTISDVGHRWPYLRELCFALDWEHPAPGPRATQLALRAFSRYCPQICKLEGVAVEAGTVPDPSGT
ncbi:hypothetical protein FB451DRAFT_1567202, partial [Mycena latifolia]